MTFREHRLRLGIVCILFVLDQDALGRAVEVVVLAAFHAPEEGEKAGEAQQ